MPTLKEWLDRYLDALERENLSPYTVKNYGTDIGQFLDYCAEQKITALEGLQRDLLRDYLVELAQLEYVRASIARRVFELRAFGDYLIQSNAWKENLFRRISAPRVPQRLPRYLTYEEIDRLLTLAFPDTPQGQRDRAILETLYASGVRVSELVGLDLADVNLNSHELRVIGKGDKERIALIGRPAVTAMRTYLAAARPALIGRRVTNAFFLNRLGSRLTMRSVDEIVRTAGEAAGIDRTVTPHLLRHTFATHMLDGGADLRVVQELLGHSSPTTTQIYANITSQRAREIYHKAHPREKTS